MFLKIGKIHAAEVESIEEAVEVFRSVRDGTIETGTYGEGYSSSDFADGVIFLHLKGKVDTVPLAKISYNGRVWNPDGSEYKHAA